MGAFKNPLWAAVALGLCAGALAWASIRARERRIEERWRTVEILCAKTDVREGTELTAEMIAVREMPVRFVTASYLQATAASSPVGQRLTAPLKAGDPILLSHFDGGREADFSSMISPKGRAVTIDVQEKTAVGLWVRPNDHVDVVGSFRDPQTQDLRAVTLLQNVVVLATGHITASSARVADDDRHFQSVTLLVLPEEAEILTVAQELGTLTLLLRNPDDLDAQEKRLTVDQKAVLTGDRAAELQQKRYHTIQIIRGALAREGAR